MSLRERMSIILNDIAEKDNLKVKEEYNISYESIQHEMVSHSKDYRSDPKVAKKCFFASLKKLKLLHSIENEQSFRMIFLSIMTMVTCLKDASDEQIDEAYLYLCGWNSDIFMKQYQKILWLYTKNCNHEAIRILLHDSLLRVISPYTENRNDRLVAIARLIFDPLISIKEISRDLFEFLYMHFDHHIFTSLAMVFLTRNQLISFTDVWNFIVDKKAHENNNINKEGKEIYNVLGCSFKGIWNYPITIFQIVEFNYKNLAKKSNLRSYRDIYRSHDFANLQEMVDEFGSKKLSKKTFLFWVQQFGKDSNQNNTKKRLIIFDITNCNNSYTVYQFLYYMRNPFDQSKRLFLFEGFERIGGLEKKPQTSSNTSTS